MKNDLKEVEESRNILRIESAYSSSVHKLDIHDCIQVRNENNVVIESLTIDQMIKYFYENSNAKIFGIDRAFIWNLDEKRIVKEITDLPDSVIKETKKNKRIEQIIFKIAKLNEELENLTNGK